MFSIRYTLTSLRPHEETPLKRHSIELTLLLSTKVVFLKPMQTTEALKSAKCLSWNFSANIQQYVKQRQNAEI